jgi:hypothetical protein
MGSFYFAFFSPFLFVAPSDWQLYGPHAAGLHPDPVALLH